MSGWAQINRSYGFNKRASTSAEASRISGLNAARTDVEKGIAGYQGYIDYGNQSLERMNRLFTNPSYIEQTPGYQFSLEQGLKGTTALRSKTSIFSGQTLKALTDYASGLASKTFNDTWNQLQTGINTGMTAQQGVMTGQTTLAEIAAGKGEAAARQKDQMSAWYAGQEGFGRQIAGQWSGAFAGAIAGDKTGGK